MPTLQDCHGCGPLWYLLSIKNTTGSLYQVNFDALRVTTLIWSVRQGCTIHKTGTINPTSSAISIDLSGVPDGEYELVASSPSCKGYAFPLPFFVSHSGGGALPPITPVLFAKSASEDSIKFNWDYTGNPDDFQLQYSLGEVWQNVDGGVFGGGARSHLSTPWPTGVEFFFRIRARSVANGNSEWSDPVFAAAEEVLPQGTIPFRFFMTAWTTPNPMVNLIGEAKADFPLAKFALPIIFNWRDTIVTSSVNGTTKGGINDFASTLARWDDLMSKNIIPFVIIDTNSMEGAKLGSATIEQSDYVKRRDNGGTLTRVSWSSPRMENVYAYYKQCINAILAHDPANFSKIYTVETPFTNFMEMEYPTSGFGGWDNTYDYNPYELANFRQWMGNKNWAVANAGGFWDGINRTPTSDNIPTEMSDNAMGTNWKLFKRAMLVRTVQKASAAVKSVGSSLKYELNSGFFSDNDFNFRNSDVALTGILNASVDVYKHNPARAYHQAMSNKLVSGVREDQASCIEWTRADGDLSEPAFTHEIVAKILKSIDDGVTSISLSFYEGASNHAYLFNPNNPTDNNTVLGRLHNNGGLYKEVNIMQNANSISLYINSSYLSGSGFLSDGAVKSAIDAAIQSNGSNKVKVKVNWDLGQFLYL